MSITCPNCGFSEVSVGPLGQLGQTWLVDGRCVSCHLVPAFEPTSAPAPVSDFPAVVARFASPTLPAVELNAIAAQIQQAVADALEAHLTPAALLRKLAETDASQRERLYVLLDALESTGTGDSKK